MTTEYLNGHQDGLEWAARLVESDDPRTGDWRYDDRSELAAAIRKGPEMPFQAPDTGLVGVLARAIDLHEKAAMPWPEAERLALREAGVDDAEIDEVVGEAGGLEKLLTTPDDLRDFARSVLVHGSARIAAIPAPEGAQLPPLPEPDQLSYVTDSVLRKRAIRSYTADQMRAYARAALAAPAPQAPVALTDYQIVRIYEQPELAGTRHESGTAKAIAIARAIERAHGIPAPKEPTHDR